MRGAATLSQFTNFYSSMSPVGERSISGRLPLGCVGCNSLRYPDTTSRASPRRRPRHGRMYRHPSRRPCVARISPRVPHVLPSDSLLPRARNEDRADRRRRTLHDAGIATRRTIARSAVARKPSDWTSFCGSTAIFNGNSTGGHLPGS